MKAADPDRERLHKIFKEMEFSKLLKEFSAQPEPSGKDYHLVMEEKDFLQSPSRI